MSYWTSPEARNSDLDYPTVEEQQLYHHLGIEHGYPPFQHYGPVGYHYSAPWDGQPLISTSPTMNLISGMTEDGTISTYSTPDFASYYDMRPSLPAFAHWMASLPQEGRRRDWREVYQMDRPPAIFTSNITGPDLHTSYSDVPKTRESIYIPSPKHVLGPYIGTSDSSPPTGTISVQMPEDSSHISRLSHPPLCPQENTHSVRNDKGRDVSRDPARNSISCEPRASVSDTKLPSRAAPSNIISERSSMADLKGWLGTLDIFQRYNLPDLERTVKAFLEQQSTKESMKMVSELSLSELAALVDVLHEVLQLSNGLKHRRRLDRFLSRIVKKTGQLPTSMLIDNVQRIGSNQSAGGGFADVWRGMLGNIEVAMKVLRVYGDKEIGKQFLREFCSEALIWHRLKHRNVMPFIGICVREFAPRNALISPWMKNGHILDYLRNHPSVNRSNLMLGVALGLEYLHTLKPAVVHGDLRASNVLIDDDGQPRISDFGLATFIDSKATTLTRTSFNGKGSMRWQAPELLTSLFEDIAHGLTTNSDVYAFACVCLEIFTEKIPFSDLKDGMVLLEVAVNHRRPPRPTQPAEKRGLSDEVWSLMQDCWKAHPSDRPNMSSVVPRVRVLTRKSGVEDSMLA